MTQTFQLNLAQQQIVDTTEGPVLVIAGPGSGKTKTLVERVVHLLEMGIEPKKIMVATFTVKAAKEFVFKHISPHQMLASSVDYNLYTTRLPIFKTTLKYA